MIKRKVTAHIKHIATLFPVISLTGPRQSGKTTLLKNLFPDYKYVSLENPESLEFALSDPKGFLYGLNNKCIIDEAQNAPELFSYIQGIVDETDEAGMFILSGSQNFLLANKISQSLAGRVAVICLLPFCYSELAAAKSTPANEDIYILNGGYPRLYDKKMTSTEYYPNYIATYVERDVRQIKNIVSSYNFTRFMKLLAARVGSILDITSLANDADISVKTVKEWLSVLESSYITFRSAPYLTNARKRITKSPKLYFYDTGLACSLLDIHNAEFLALHPLKGQLFENMIIAEFLKEGFAAGVRIAPNFWRVSETQEVDLIIDAGYFESQAIEIKTSHTFKSNFSRNLTTFCSEYNWNTENCAVVYAGDKLQKFNGIRYVPFGQIDSEFKFNSAAYARKQL